MARWSNTLRCWCGLREERNVAEIALIDTSLRDGNQSTWGAVGIDTAMTLTIAPVMDRVGFKAIDFTTSTHMGIAVRYKREDPWERIRLMAAATPNTPLQFMSTGFRFISWETASPEFMALAFEVLARNGIRRFCLADPMNDAESNVACARMVKRVGGEFVIAALVFTLSPIHDDRHYAQAARKLAACPEAEGLAVGATQPFDAAYLRHQLPGGMIGTMRRQLAEQGLAHLEGAVIEEIARVREELGWPIVMTPFSQILLTQAFLNVTGRERYAAIPDEAIRYALGRFSRPNVPIAPEVMERIESLPRTRELRAEPAMPPIAELRARLGRELSDEELLLRATMPATQVDAMRAAGPAALHYDPESKPVMELLRRVLKLRGVSELSVVKSDFKLELRGGAGSRALPA